MTETDLMDRARRLLADHGDVRPQPASDWRGPFALPPAVADYYDRVGPVDVSIPGYGNDYFVPALTRLWDGQEGYRWHGRTAEPLPGWDDAWLVVATCGGDPLIYDGTSGRVLFAWHGEGSWAPGECFADLPTMAACLATLGSVIESAGEGFTDDDAYVRPAHRDRAVALLADILGSRPAAASVVERVAGWG